MNKLNKELCEVLKIKPYIPCDVCTVGIPPNNKCYTCIYDSETKIYPDLTDPNNFVKLLKISTTSRPQGIRLIKDNPTTELIDQILFSAKRVALIETIFIEQLKNQAQKVKWDY